ncbi:MAG: FMN-binding protein [Coriobacteriia bacterium]|nr:FMN-binding protein [Coriobacteriia bacterium]
MTKKKLLIGIIGLVFVAAVAFGGTYLYDTMRYKAIISDIVITTPNTSLLPDGTYNGSFDAILVAADIDVSIKDNQISSIVINSHKNERGSAAEVIIDMVVASQTLEVDTVSGATNSSLVILKAIENALS